MAMRAKSIRPTNMSWPAFKLLHLSTGAYHRRTNTKAGKNRPYAQAAVSFPTAFGRVSAKGGLMSEG